MKENPSSAFVPRVFLADIEFAANLLDRKHKSKLDRAVWARMLWRVAIPVRRTAACCQGLWLGVLGDLVPRACRAGFDGTVYMT